MTLVSQELFVTVVTRRSVLTIRNPAGIPALVRQVEEDHQRVVGYYHRMTRVARVAHIDHTGRMQIRTDMEAIE